MKGGAKMANKILNIKKIKRVSGFTLIELLIVIAIIAVLSAVLISVLNPTQQRNKALDSNNRQTLTRVAEAMTACFIEYGGWTSCASEANLETAGYLETTVDLTGFTFGAGCLSVPHLSGTGYIKYYYGTAANQNKVSAHCTYPCGASGADMAGCQ